MPASVRTFRHALLPLAAAALVAGSALPAAAFPAPPGSTPQAPSTVASPQGGSVAASGESWASGLLVLPTIREAIAQPARHRANKHHRHAHKKHQHKHSKAPHHAKKAHRSLVSRPQTRLTAVYHAPKPKGDVRVARTLSIMRSETGRPYVYGAAGPNAFDCSGLVYYASHRAGFSGVPRTSSAQAGYMRHIPRSQMRAGDFVFFGNGGGVYHVGVYVGHNTILHAPRPGSSVRYERIWTNGWFAGTLRGK